MPSIPAAQQSSSSLLDAVLGGQAPSSGSPSSGSGGGRGIGAGPGASRLQNAFSPLGYPTASSSTAPPVAYAFKRNKIVRNADSDADALGSASSGSRTGAGQADRTPSTRSGSASNTETESWDLLSDADSRLNGTGEDGGADRQVEELQRNVQKR
jgi:hypothetical protein